MPEQWESLQKTKVVHFLFCLFEVPPFRLRARFTWASMPTTERKKGSPKRTTKKQVCEKSNVIEKRFQTSLDLWAIFLGGTDSF